VRKPDQRPPLPAQLTAAERDFYTQLRQMVGAAGLSCRALEESTSSARSDAEPACFYSKSQWGRWLNGESLPPRKAVRKLVEVLAAEQVDASRLIDLWGRAFAPADSGSTWTGKVCTCCQAVPDRGGHWSGDRDGSRHSRQSFMAGDRATGAADGGRRFLLTGVIGRYHHDSRWNREELDGDLTLMIDLFTRDLGYEHVPVMGLDPTWLQVQDALREFCTDPDRRADDYVAVYLAGHGEILPVGATGAEHVLLPADAAPGDLRRRAIKSADLAEWMLAETKVRRLLILVDTCLSGQGGVDFARNAAAWTGSAARFGEPEGVGVVVVSATQPKQEAVAGMFAGGFARAVRSQATAGHAPGELSIDAVVNVLNSDPQVPASQQAQWSLMLGSGKIPDFLPNQRRDGALVDLNLAGQARRWQGRVDQENRRAEELRRVFVPRAAGFIGRRRALTDLSRWLDDMADARPRVITGDPGSGKTAILGVLAALSDPRRRPTVPRDGLPGGIVPRAGMIDVAVYAGNLTSGQVLAALAAAANIEDIDPDPAAFDLGVAQLVTRLGERDRPLVAVVDALDEAADPAHLAQRLLRPLIEDGRSGVRLLLGTRRHVCDHLGTGWTDRCVVIDLDEPGYADPRSVAALVRRILRQGDAPAAGGPSGVSPFTSCSPAVLESVTAAIADAAGLSFFVARILAATQASQPVLPDPADPAWRAGLPSQAGPAMRRDLHTRLGENATRAIHLLLPLAYAQGGGLAWEDIWPLLANALSAGHGYTNEDLLWLADQAGSYIVESGTLAGRSLYRLYHRSLAEYLRGERDQDADEYAIAAALAVHVPLRENGRPDWPAAHPYTRVYLAAHAASGGTIDDLAQDPGFLLAAEPAQLLTALDTTADQSARAAAGAYRRALPYLRRHPSAEHAAYLSLGALRGRAKALADRIAADGLESPWTPRWASWQPRRPRQEPAGHPKPVNAVAVAEPSGRPVVISGGDDHAVQVWDLRTGAPVGGPFTGHTGPVWAVAVADLDGRPVAVSGGADHTVQVWDLATGTPAGGPFTGHTGPVWAVAVAELDGRPVAVSGGADRTVRVWDLATGTPVGDPFTGHRGTVSAVAVGELAGCPVAVSGSDDRTVRIWDLATGTPVGDPFTSRARTVTVPVAELDGCPVAVSGSDDQTVQGQDLATGTATGEPFTGHTSWVRTVAVAELDGRPVAVSGSSDRTVRVWDLATGTPVGDPFTGHTSWVRTVAVADLDGRPVVISGSDDRTVRIWDLATGAPVGDPFTAHISPVWAVAVADLDGRPVVISGSDDHTVQVWDLATRTLVGDPFTGHTSWVRTVAVAELDGRPVAVSGSDDLTVQVWDLATRTLVGDPFTGHALPVRAVAVADLDGRPVVISGSDDRTVRIWDLATGAPIGDPFACTNGPVLSVAIAAAADCPDPRARNRPVHLVIGEGGTVSVQALSRISDTTTWTQIVAPQIGNRVLATAWHPPRTLVVGTELGIVALEVPP
jgi:WD40 repeat protein